jgi:hypothetical protein
VAAAWLTVAVKLAVSALGVLAIVRSGSSHRPRRLLRVLTWVAAIVLMLYGTVLTAVGVAVESGLVCHGAHADLIALRWHASLWDPWFLLWGLLLMTGLVLSHPHTAPTTAIPQTAHPGHDGPKSHTPPLPWRRGW